MVAMPTLEIYHMGYGRVRLQLINILVASWGPNSKHELSPCYNSYIHSCAISQPRSAACIVLLLE